MGEQDEVATLRAAASEIDTAAGVLRRHLWRILARAELSDTTAAVHVATAAVTGGARRRIAAGDPEGALGILEAGRGLALFAATEVRTVAEHLERGGKTDLARQWRATAGVEDPQLLPAELRRDVLTALRAQSPAAGLLAPPSLGEIQEALAAGGADALVYLLPGHALIAPARGAVRHLPLPGLTSGTVRVERLREALAESTVSPRRPSSRREDGQHEERRREDGLRDGGQRGEERREDGLHDGGRRGDGSRADGRREDGRREDGRREDGRRDYAAADLNSDAGGYLNRREPENRHGPTGADATLDRICAWAWDTAIGPLLDLLTGDGLDRPPRVVLVPFGDLARVPWHAARRPDGTYAVEHLAISYAVSARMLCRTAAVEPLPPGNAGLVVGDPETGDVTPDLTVARREAFAIRRAFYRAGRYVGRTPNRASSRASNDASSRASNHASNRGGGPSGNLAQVRAWLTTTSPAAGDTLHLACEGVARSRPYVKLAGGEPLSATEVLRLRSRPMTRPIELVVVAGSGTGLPQAGADEAYGMPSAFLAAGVRSVVAARWTPSPALMFMVHHFRRAGRPAWAALREAQLWMLDPERVFPADLPPDLVPDGGVPGWAAVAHWGA